LPYTTLFRSKASMPSARVTGYDADPAVVARAQELGFCDDVADSAGAAVIDADLVLLCVPVGAMAAIAEDIAEDLPKDAVISDVGSSKSQVITALSAALPGARIIPAHPVAGTEHSGPDAGFATLDRKSTRLNSSHVKISYAVFCLKKKNQYD